MYFTIINYTSIINYDFIYNRLRLTVVTITLLDQYTPKSPLLLNAQLLSCSHNEIYVSLFFFTPISIRK